MIVGMNLVRQVAWNQLAPSVSAMLELKRVLLLGI